MTSLTFYGGVNEIGGNKILLEDKDTKVFLDFGMSFGLNAKYFQGYLQPRSFTGITDYLEMGLIPNIKGIYRDDLLKIAGRKKEPVDVDGVLLSHAHADHASYISFLHKDIPIYMGETCKLILEAIKDIKRSNIENEILEYKEKSDEKKPPVIARKIETFRTGKTIKIGSLKIEPIHVDHSVPGAYGFIIYTSSGPVVYTGDLRLHGTKPKMTQDFVERATKVKPIALIAEGTRITEPTSDESEKKVYTDCKEFVNNTDKLVMADFSFKDVDRLRTFYKIAKETGRKFVVNAKDGPYLEHLSKDKQLNVPHPDDEYIIFHKGKKSRPVKGEKKYSEHPNALSAEDIAKKESKVLCALGMFNFTSLIDMKPKSGATYIHSKSEPYNDEGEVADDLINNWLNKFGMNRFQSHCSGHAKGNDLFEIVKTIDARMLFPIHTENPTEYVRATNKMTIVEEGKKYKIS